MPQLTLTRRQAAQSMAAGARAAGDAKALATACPHRPGGGADERVLAAAWLRGFLQARHIIR